MVYYTPSQVNQIAASNAPAPAERTPCYCDSAYHPAGH